MDRSGPDLSRIFRESTDNREKSDVITDTPYLIIGFQCLFIDSEFLHFTG